VSDTHSSAHHVLVVEIGADGISERSQARGRLARQRVEQVGSRPTETLICDATRRLLALLPELLLGCLSGQRLLV
jgi:hypothetical protein